MAIFFDITTIVITIYLCINNFKNIALSSRYILYYFFVLLYVVPLLLDYIIMMPDYTLNNYVRGFLLSYNDDLTRCIYDIGIVFAEFVILKFRNYYNEVDENLIITHEEDDFVNNYRTILLTLAILPALLAIIFPVNKGILYIFQWREYGLFQYDKYMMLLEKMVYVALSCSLLLAFDRSISKFLRAVSVILIYVNICIQGKRSILFFALVFAVLLLIPGFKEDISIRTRRRKMRSVVILAAVAVVVMLVITISVQTSRLTSYGETDSFECIYTTTRIDFFRDDRVRMAIYSLLHPDEISILDYPGQTIWPIFTWMFPFDYIFGAFGVSPNSYQVYFSAAMEGWKVSESVSLMTPCIYAELISNFGFLGLIIMPFLTVWISKKADKYAFPFNLLIMILFIALNLYTTKYIAYLLELVLILYMNTKVKFTIGSKRLL